ncbi:MAG TPA: hypothetical protein PKK06_00080 [Phycisphaerae bacterium]|nr:hypothetical protein [Phycisphaerae bacterium]HNU43992.1 hypothetical protein [Phycisphaerae bacterium]
MKRFVALLLIGAATLAQAGCVVVATNRGPIGTARRQVVSVDGKLYVVDMQDHTYYRIEPAGDEGTATVTYQASKIEVQAEADGK